MNDDLMFTAGIDRDKFKKDIDAILKDVVGLDKAVQKTDFIGVVKENLNIQKEVIKTLKSDIKDLYSTIEKTAPGIAQNNLIAEVKILEAELNAEVKTLAELEAEIKKSDEAHKSLGVQLQAVKAEMQKLRLEGKENTEQYRQLEEKATKYQASINDVNKSITTLSKGGFQPLSSLLSEVTGAFSLGAGAVALFTGENENLSKITEKLNAITAIAVGAQNLNTQAMATSATISGFFSNASQRLAVSIGISTAAARAFLLTITGGLIVAIPALIYLYDRYISQNSKLAKTQKDLNEATKEGNKNAASEITKLDLLYKTATNAAKATNERKKAVDQLQAGYPNYFKNLSDEIIMNGKAINSYISLRSAIISASRAKAAQDKLDEANAGFLDEELAIRERIKQANLRYRTAKATTEYVRDPHDPKGSIMRTVSKEENQARAKREFEDETERLKQLYIQRNRTLEPYIKFIDAENKKSKPYIDGLEKGKTAKTDTHNPTPTKETPQTIAEEILPAGSVAEIQKRLAAIDDALSKANSDEVISVLKDKRIKTLKELADAEARISTDTRDKEKEELEKQLQQLLESRRNYEEKIAAIKDKYSKLSSVAKTDAEKSKVDAAMREEISKLTSEEFKKSELWAKAFGDASDLTIKQLREILEKLKKELSENADKYTVADLKALNEQIQKTEQKLLGSQNPFKLIKEGIRAIGDESLTTSDKMKKLDNATDGMKQLFNTVQKLSDQLGIAKGEFAEFLNTVNNTIQSVEEMKNSYKDYQQAKDDGDTFGQIAGGLAMAGAAVKAITGIVKWISGIGDRRKENRIKEWAAEVANLKTKYDELQHAVKKALGEDVNKSQQAVIQNLKNQQRLLQQMLNTESNKKKADKNKIAEYKNQISAINLQISDIYDDMIQQITQTDAKSLADQLADALVDAYSRGADAAESFGKVADDVMKNAVKNALKTQLLAKPMENIINQLLKNMGFDENGNGYFDGLTNSEREEIRDLMKAASTNYMNALGAYSEFFGQQAGNAQGMKGDIKGISEKTAGALEAQINAIRIMQAENHNVMRSSLMQLSKIEENTRPLRMIQKDISEMNFKMKPDLAGIRASGGL